MEDVELGTASADLGTASADLEGPSDNDLFDETTSDTAAPEDAKQGLAEAEPEKDEQPRDEAGKFVAKEAEKPTADVTAEKSVVDDNAAQVPSWRVKEINEEKRQLATELETLRAERTQWQQRQQQPQPVQQQVQQPAKPDPLLDPEGYAAAVRAEVREEVLADRREESLLRARDANQPEFDEAYKAAQQHIDPALKARMQQSRDPGKELLAWHREIKTRAEVGNDLGAYKQRLRDEALKDPEFRKQAMAAWRNDAQPSTNGRPNVSLPPSLNGASRSNAALQSGDNDELDDQALFEQLTG